MTSLSTAIPYTAGKRDDENGDVGSNISETENIGLHQDSVALTFNQDTSLEAILSAQDLLSRNPIKFGFLDKYSNSFLAWLLPFFFPRWRRRFFILVGNYLFRFSSESGDKPKGVPIPLDVVTVVRSEDDESCFELTTIRKTYLIRAESEDECNDWMSKIKERKAGAIRENLGHAQVSKEIRKINKTAATLFERTVQKDTEEAESSQKELYRLTHNPMFSNMAEMPR